MGISILLLIDKTNPFGNGYLLPRWGILWEPLKEIKHASYVFINKSDCCQNDELVGIVKHYNLNATLYNALTSLHRVSFPCFQKIYPYLASSGRDISSVNSESAEKNTLDPNILTNFLFIQ